MNMSVQSPRASATPWYLVVEVWLILFLLSAAVIGSFALLATAVRNPDRHLVVPNDVPRSSHMPPLAPAAATVDPPKPRH